MKPRLASIGGARAVAADVIARVLDDGAWAQPALASALQSSGLDARDKALCTELVYGALRWAKPLEASLLRSANKPGRGLDKRMRPHLLVAAYQLQHLSERIPAHAAVSAAVDAVRAVRPGLEGFANALLRHLGSPLHVLLAANATTHEVADALGVPHALADAITADLPHADVKDALLALNGRPSTFALALGDGTIPTDAVPHAFVPGSFVLDRGAVAEVTGFKEGRFLVLDPGSAVAALLVAATPGMRVIDLCAAPGGKSAVLAAAVGDSGRVVAVEKSPQRAKKIGETAARTGLGARIDVVVGDALTEKLAEASVVLLDAPCTGLGTTRRKPEIKLRRTDDDIHADAALQAALLARAATLVKPGGALVYSVCSPIPAEGEAQIDKLLASRADLVVVNARETLPWLPADAVSPRGFVKLLPHRHDSDAFFCARLVKRP